MKKEFVVERQGRAFVLFAGLLDEAHRQGLKRVETQLVQIPGPDNGQVAISRALVETERGVFTGIGDASPTNVGRNIVPHIIRMSETRAMARALRVAINVGAAALEELGENEDDEPTAPAVASTSTTTTTTPPPSTTPPPKNGRAPGGPGQQGPSLVELATRAYKLGLVTKENMRAWCAQAGVEKLTELSSDAQATLRHRLADLISQADEAAGPADR